MPKTIVDIHSRIDALSKSKKLPMNLDKAKLESAKSDLAEVSKSWGEASKAYKEGSLADALAKGKGAKEKAAQIMASSGCRLPQRQEPSQEEHIRVRLLPPGGDDRRHPSAHVDTTFAE